MNEQPLFEFDSHIAGKNAIVKLFPDRVEWGSKGWLSTGANGRGHVVDARRAGGAGW